MNRTSAMITGTALGAGLMYLLDPISGRRRRAYARDKLTHLAKEADIVTRRTARDLSNRYQGLVAEAEKFRTEEGVPDHVLMDRVRTALGRVISHPGSVNVHAVDGTVTLSGPILASDENRLLRRVRAIRGVREVQNELEVHRSASHISGLQGGVPRRERFELLQTNWSPAVRLLSIIGGSAAALYGLGRRGAAGIGATLVGASLMARGATNTDLRRLLGMTPREPEELMVQKTVYIEAPVEKVLSMWTNLNNLPRFLPGLHEIKDIGEGKSLWAVHVDDIPVHWESVMVASKNMLSWKSQPGAIFANSGIVRFDPAVGGTRVQVTLFCRPSRGLPRRIAARWFGPNPSRYLTEALAGMKRMIETETWPGESRPEERAAS